MNTKNPKNKFRPLIIKVKLNPEQAVLSCDCYAESWKSGGLGRTFYPRNGISYKNGPPCLPYDRGAAGGWISFTVNVCSGKTSQLLFTSNTPFWQDNKCTALDPDNGSPNTGSS